MGLYPEATSAGSAANGAIRRLIKAIGLVLLYGVAWLLVSLSLLPTANIILGDVVESMDDASEMAYEGVFMILAVAIVNLIILCGFKSRAAAAGWPNLRLGVTGFGNGALIGLGMSGGMFVLTLLMSGGEFSVDGNPWTDYLMRVIPLLLFVLVSTLGEEWLFRGYPLTVLANATNAGWANLLMALLFSLMHATAAGFNGLVAFNIVIGSLVVGALRFTRGGIPTAWGFHFAWNGMQVVAGSNLTGLNLQVPVLHYTAKGSVWLSGGALGPEGGIGAALSTLIVLGCMVVYFRRRGIAVLPVPFGRRNPETVPQA